MKSPAIGKLHKLRGCFDYKAGGDAKLELYSEEKDILHPFPVYTNSSIENQIYAYSSIAPFKYDSITVTGRGDIGKAFFREGGFDAIIRLVVLTPKGIVCNKFFTYFIDEVIPFFSDSAAVAQLSAQQIANYSLIFPPLSEQKAIADYLDRKCGEIDSLKDKLKQKKEKLQELRQSLISEVVTGKRKVI